MNMDVCLVGDRGIIENKSDASQIYNKGFFGEPQHGGTLLLDFFELVYLLEFRKVNVVDGKGRAYGLEELINYAHKRIKSFEIKYIVYRDMRSRGFVLKKGDEEIHFMVFPRGAVPTKTPAKYWLIAMSERQIFDYAQMYRCAERAHELKKEVLIGTVDEESDLTYYIMRIASMHGNFSEQIEGKITGIFLEDRVLIFDELHSNQLYQSGFYGHMVGTRLQLSLIEACYLAEKNVLELIDARTQKTMDVENFRRKCRKIQKDFDARFQVYKELKSKKLIVKTGFKYGTHFRAYEGNPDQTHAKYLVHAVPSNYKGIWPDISGAVRLAHGVKKSIIFAGVGDERVMYLSLERIRP